LLTSGERAWAIRRVQLKETKDLKDKRIRLILLGRMLEVSGCPMCTTFQAAAR